MNDIETRLNEFEPVDGFQCPAEFWPAMGYEESGRFVAIYWEQCGDEASWADGRDALCGADWPSYLALLQHNFPAGHPVRWLWAAATRPPSFGWSSTARRSGRG